MDIGNINNLIQDGIWLVALVLFIGRLIAKRIRGETVVPTWIRNTLSSNIAIGVVIGLGLISSAMSSYPNVSRYFNRSPQPEPRLTAREMRNKEWQDSMSHLTIVSDKHFANERIEVDGYSYHHCTFKNVTLDYKGEKAFDFEDNTFEGSAWLDLSQDLSLDGLMTLQIMLGALKPGITVDDKREHVTSFGAPATGSLGPAAPSKPHKSQSQNVTNPAAVPQIEQHGTASGAVGGSITQGADSIAQIGGTNNSAIITSPIPFRVLTDRQKEGIGEFVKTLPPSVKVAIGGVYGSGDAVTYAAEFIPLFNGRLIANQTTPAIKTGFPITWTGVFVAVATEEDSATKYRNELVDKLISLGIPARKANGGQVPRGSLELLVGFRPEEVKQR